MEDLLPLEAELVRRARSEKDAANFWHRYSSMKSYLADEYYRWVQANLPYFTDHGEQHIHSVLSAAGSLLKPELRRAELLSSLDIFLILSVILWHDVGLVYSRRGHADISKMTEKIKVMGFPDLTIQRLANEISSAHSGVNGLEKAREHEDCSTSQKTYSVRPRALAALVRFADEISENRHRISQELLDSVPSQNRVHWEYANCVAACAVDPTNELVKVSLEVESDSIGRTFDCDDFPARNDGKTIPLIEYIVCRLEKMNNERAYCAPEFRPYVRIERIVASFTMLSGGRRLSDRALEVTLGNLGLSPVGYPNIRVFDTLFSQYPQLKPANPRNGSI